MFFSICLTARFRKLTPQSLPTRLVSLRFYGNENERERKEKKIIIIMPAINLVFSALQREFLVYVKSGLCVISGWVRNCTNTKQVYGIAYCFVS